MADEGNVNYMGLRSQIRWRPNDAIDINIIGDYTIDERWQAGSVLFETTWDINPYGAGIPTIPVCLWPLPQFRQLHYTNDPDAGQPTLGAPSAWVLICHRAQFQ